MLGTGTLKQRWQFNGLEWRRVDMKTVQDVTGHTGKVMVLRYSHSTKESRRQAVEALNSGAPRQKLDSGQK